MALYEYAHDLDTPVHPVSAPDYMPLEQMQALQLHRLQGLVRRVYDNVPLTRARMDERGVRPEHIRTLKDIARLP
ncbi:MAG: phenylacetate--CoA ligase, partial [Kiritimatiellia bacterium]